jgi:MoaA/NifB/PqqE/SkfB family radical SAM enzyme
VHVVGISVDGLEEYHNWWRGAPEGLNPFRKALELLSESVLLSSAPGKLEVSLVPTKRNLAQITDLMRLISGLGIRRFSVHRAMPVGRFLRWLDLLPDAREYLEMIIRILEVNQELGMRIHFHHTIESIYASLLLGYDTFSPTVVGNPEGCSSLGIDAFSRVHFDPWCVAEPLSSFHAGSLVTGEASLAELLQKAEDWCHVRVPELRCRGCDVKCSGGSRVAAAMAFLKRQLGYSALARGEFDLGFLLEAMLEVDPACPLYWIRHRNSGKARTDLAANWLGSQG